MNLVDSSAWLEYFANTKHAKYFAKAIENTKLLLVPTIVLYEVFKKTLVEKDENTALQIVAHMKVGKVVDLDLALALWAAKISREHKIPVADSIIAATAKRYGATIWTLDADLKDFENVEYVKK